MPELYEQDIPKTPAQTTPEERELINKLWDYTEAKSVPWQADYQATLAECNNFAELRQWDSPDVKLLADANTPQLPVDRIGRNLDVVNGIRANTGNNKRIVKRELGDERVASILNDIKDYVEYTGDFEEVRDKANEHLLREGMGIRKLGFDKALCGGEGAIWAQHINTEDCGWAQCDSREFEGVEWIWHRQVMPWGQAIMINPDKAPQLNSLKMTLSPKWEELKGGNAGSLLGRDYGGQLPGSEGVYDYPDNVTITEVWVKRRIPYRLVGSIQPAQVDPNGNLISLPEPITTKQSPEYQVQEGEEDLGVALDEFYEQYILASGKGKIDAFILKQGQDKDHPFVGMCAETKKSGAPVGLVEKLIPHQKRKNIAWAQKVLFNNKSIKTPLAIEGGDPNTEVLAQQSTFGAILRLRTGEKIISINQQPGVNLQAIEEGEAADAAMDFAAAASEPVLRGAAGSGSSGIQLVRQQDAAITPLNKWVKADGMSEKVFGRKLLRLIIKNFKPERMARIVGAEKFFTTLGYVMTPNGLQPNPMAGQPDPVTGAITPTPVPLPLSLDIEHYDVIVEDKSLSDFNKQQTFNAIEAMVQGGVFFTDDFRIRNAPIKDIDGAIASNRQARMDVIRQLMIQVQILQSQIQDMQKLIPRENKGGPTQQGGKGKAASQAGQRSMVGGANMLGMKG